MSNRTCDVPGCERKRFARGWCHAHYNRWQRDGDPGTTPVRPRRTSCLVDGCERKHYGRGYCQTHLYRLRSNGDPLVTRPPGMPAGEEHFAYLGEDVGYAAVHQRLRRQFGPASGYACDRCSSPARDWAYQHDAGDERIDEQVGLPYTTTLCHYRPMCSPCHRKLDALHGWVREHPERSRGVSQLDNGRWRAYASLDGKQYAGGYYASKDEAADASRRLRRTLLEGGDPAAVRPTVDRSKCPHGHVYDEANTYITPRGGRVCRTCRREGMARRRTTAA